MLKIISELHEYDITRILRNEKTEVFEKDFYESRIRDRFGRNISTQGVRIICVEGEDYLLFEDEYTWKNWLYYAGFEYIESEHINQIKVGDVFYCWIKAEDHSRVQEVIDMMNEEEEEETNEDEE